MYTCTVVLYKSHNRFTCIHVHVIKVLEVHYIRNKVETGLRYRLHILYHQLTLTINLNHCALCTRECVFSCKCISQIAAGVHVHVEVLVDIKWALFVIQLNGHYL